MSTIYRLPERRGSFSTRDRMKGRVIEGRDGKGIQLLNAILHFGAPPLLYNTLFLLRRSMPWKNCWNRVVGEEAIPWIVTKPGRSCLGAQENTKNYR